MARYRGEDLSLQANDLGAPVTSTGYCVDVEGEADGDPADLNTANEPLEHTILTTKITEQQEACRRVQVAVPLSMIDVADFSLPGFSAVVSADTSFTDGLRHTAKELEV